MVKNDLGRVLWHSMVIVVIDDAENFGINHNDFIGQDCFYCDEFILN